jgi:hypothetical protein
MFITGFPLTSSKLGLHPCSLLICDPFLYHTTVKACASKVVCFILQNEILQAFLFPHTPHPNQPSVFDTHKKNVILYSSWTLLILDITAAQIMCNYVYYKGQYQHFQIIIFSHYGHYLCHGYKKLT